MWAECEILCPQNAFSGKKNSAPATFSLKNSDSAPIFSQKPFKNSDSAPISLSHKNTLPCPRAANIWGQSGSDHPLKFRRSIHDQRRAAKKINYFFLTVFPELQRTLCRDLPHAIDVLLNTTPPSNTPREYHQEDDESIVRDESFGRLRSYSRSRYLSLRHCSNRNTFLSS